MRADPIPRPKVGGSTQSREGVPHAAPVRSQPVGVWVAVTDGPRREIVVETTRNSNFGRISHPSPEITGEARIEPCLGRTRLPGAAEAPSRGRLRQQAC